MPPISHLGVDDIQAEAANLGFILFGVAQPKPTPHVGFFETWLDHQFHGEMKYLANDRSRLLRANPQQILPSARSVLVLGTRYGPPRKYQTADLDRGLIAAYAYSEDYHKIIPQRIDELILKVRRISGVSNIEFRHYTDSGPVLERDFGVQAGLGWVGKNTSIISPAHGSYIFLSTCFLTLEIDPNSPFGDERCGTCHRCISECPTGCILPDRSIDARRCISYLTIENRGVIPAQIRPKLRNWVFGCDICQMVCPWNNHASHRQIQNTPTGISGVDYPTISTELVISNQDFQHKFQNSPILRARRNGYVRNMAVAAGNSGLQSCIPPLSTLLTTDPDAIIRGHAAWALGNFRLQKTRQLLVKALSTETNSYVLSEINTALEIS